MSVQRNPKDSIASTWRQKDRSEWNIFHWIYEILQLHPVNLDKQIPVHPKTDKVPYLNDCLSTWQAIVLYSLAFKLKAIRELHLLRRIGEQIGSLDGDAHERDGVPDNSVIKVDKAPASMGLYLLPLETGFYAIILDFWFYWYHRLMHTVEGL
ncbi:hypothetical protein MY1884_005575 [Beauveria asiatica]